MDKNAIKKFAVWARTELIARVSLKGVEYGITEDNMVDANADSVGGKVLTANEKRQRQALITEINDKGYKQVMEEVAYTWFNRFSALRFMEVNGYLPSHVRVFTDEENNFKPQIITEAIHLDLDGLDMEKVYALKDAEKTEELYKYLLIVQCNALNKILPGMFQKIADYTELLLPDNLLREGSVIQQMIELIPEDDWKDAVQIIGWLYQYYNSEKKDDVFAALKKNVKITKENIPAATQLFTPDWIVRYMVENSLGRLWLEGHPDVKEQFLPTEEEQSAYAAGNRDPEDTKWHYYLEEANQEPEVQAQLAEIRKEYAALTPDQLKVIDPCSGSGHILAYMFDVLMQIYESYGYTTREAVASIVENNLYGLDIDDRAAQLAYFAVMMKARQYDRRFFSRDIQPHVYAIAESNHVDSFALEYFCNGDAKLKKAMDTIISELYDAKEYGSILTVTPQDWSALYNRFAEITEEINVSRETALRELLPLVQVAEALAQKYDVVVTNPPYMKEDNIPHRLHEEIQKQWVNARYDLYAACMYRFYKFVGKNGYLSMITMHNFMFSPSFLELRKDFIKYDWINVLHLGSRAFSEISGEVVQTVAYTIAKTGLQRTSAVVDVTDIKDARAKEVQYGLIKSKPYAFDMKNTDIIPWNAFGYALSEKVLEYYKAGQTLGAHCVAKAGIVTGDDDFFCKLWHEVSFVEITLNPNSRELYKYVPFSRGGTFVAWFGNTHHVLRIKDMWNDALTNKSVRRGDKDYYYKTGIGWSQMGGGTNKNYSIIENSICKTTTPMLYVDEKSLNFILGYLNSPIPTKILKSLNPTLSILISDIMHLPYVTECQQLDLINNLVDKNIVLAREDEKSFECSWNFLRFPMLRCGKLAEVYTAWKADCESRFLQLKANNEELNRVFIDIYGLQEELIPELTDKDITVHRIFDTKDDVPESMKDSIYVRTMQDEIVSLISYAVGCMFGRYSPYKEGLFYAGGEWDYNAYEDAAWIAKGKPEVLEFYKQTHFMPDEDNIIPICDDEYFVDDIVGRFAEFVEEVYGADTLDENLKFIADALGGNGQPKDVIRNYFMNDFYKDHCKIYQKRPIYWLFDSGKKNGFKALIYMHRYQPDTIARIRTDYVHEQQARYRTAIADLEQRIANASTGERVKLNKRLKALNEQAAEIHAYEEKIHHLADQMISIDLDDGVKKNYAIFQDVLAKIK